jgi:radical S-adenosyl methionine domain-containing protein 2
MAIYISIDCFTMEVEQMSVKNKVSQLVINWHLTETCNYSCRYCYSAWAKDVKHRDVIRDCGASEALMAELYAFFRPGNPENPLYDRMQWETVRLNFAGGEPLLYDKKMPGLLVYARNLGFETSLITNASRLSSELVSKLAPQLSWLGISIDSLDVDTNRLIGREDRRGVLLDLQHLSKDIEIARCANPNLRLKINTVVNAHNWNEDFSPLIAQFAPAKWKILRMLPVVNKNLAVTDQQFSTFVDRHTAFSNVACIEDNGDMLQSYIMIDPQGRFYQNSRETIDTGYQYSKPIVEIGAKAAFSEMRFADDRYAARYDKVA